MNIGILGGTFNPPHSGHFKISEDSLTRFGLDQIWWVPSMQNPLKTVIAPPIESRIEECQGIISKFIKIKNIEEEISSNLTINVIKHVLKQNPQHNFYFIMGSDNLISFNKWDDWEEILTLLKIIVYERPGYNYSDISEKIDESVIRYKKSFSDFFPSTTPAWTLVKNIALDISSTQIRTKNEKKQ